MFRSTCTVFMAIGVACKVMNFKVPPVNKKELKKRFIQLAKERHPDQNTNSKTSTEDMIQLTEAYKTLKKVLEEGVGASRSFSNSKQSAAAAGSSEERMEEVARSFVIPGSDISLRGFTLPWQREQTRTAAAKAAETLLSKDTSFGDYVAGIRKAAVEQQRRERRLKEEGVYSAGSHGYTAEHFEKMREKKERLQAPKKGSYLSANTTNLAVLGWRYYTRRFTRTVKEAPGRLWDSLRYILQ